MGRALLRRPGLVDVPAWVALGWSAWTITAACRFYMRPAACLNKWDEGYITAFAGRLLDGQMLPYVDAVSQRGPVFYWFAAAAVKIWGRMSWLPVRAASLVCILLTLAFTFATARQARHMLAGGVAALATVLGLLVLMGLPDGLAFNGEHVLNLFASAALLCTTAALDPRRPRPSPALAFVAGALGALAVLSKQFGLLSVLPLGLWVLAAAVSRPALSRGQRFGLALAFGGGALLPIAAVVARYAKAGALEPLWYWLYTYNAHVYMAPFPWSKRAAAVWGFVKQQPAATVAAVALLGCGLWWGLLCRLRGARSARDLARAYDEDGFSATVALGTAAALLGAISPMRFFLHYFVHIIPWGGLLAGLLIERLFARVLERRRALSRLFARAALLGLPLLVVAAVWHGRFERQRARWAKQDEWRDGGAPAVCADIHAHAKPGDPLFVWGFQPDLYVRCKHSAASRYVFTTMQSGFVPWIPAPRAIEEARVVPGSREALIADLEASKPKVIIDAPKSLGGHSMLAAAQLADYMHDHYCEWKVVTDLKLFVRREQGETCNDALKTKAQ